MEWISVEDRLPEESGDRYEHTIIDVFADGERFTEQSFFNGRFHSPCYDYDGDFDHYEALTGVTHWMPLPEPPEDKLKPSPE